MLMNFASLFAYASRSVEQCLWLIVWMMRRLEFCVLILNILEPVETQTREPMNKLPCSGLMCFEDFASALAPHRKNGVAKAMLSDHTPGSDLCWSICVVAARAP